MFLELELTLNDLRVRVRRLQMIAKTKGLKLLFVDALEELMVAPLSDVSPANALSVLVLQKVA
jgi:hypothetical protein